MAVFFVLAAIVGTLLIDFVLAGVCLLIPSALREMAAVIGLCVGWLLVPAVALRVIEPSIGKGLRAAIAISLSAPIAIYAFFAMFTALKVDPTMASVVVWGVPGLWYLATTVWCGFREHWGLVADMVFLAAVIPFAMVAAVFIAVPIPV